MRKVCTVCDTEFKCKTENARYCSGNCRKKAYRRRCRKEYNKQCELCSKDFTTTKSNKKFCNTKCTIKSEYINRPKKTKAV